MRRYSIRIKMPEGEVKEILDELASAQEIIYKCYNRLESLGVLTVVPNEEADSGN